jgi:polyisoprenoid-binding protein YceI
MSVPETPPAVTIWTIDPDHSVAEFSIRHMMISTVKGAFPGLSGQISADVADLGSAQAHVEIDVSTVNTRQKERDAHLRSADFFDVENFPAITFDSTSVLKVSGDVYDIGGTMVIRGVSKPLTVRVEYMGTSKDPWGNTRAGFSASAELNRKDFGLQWNQALETGGVLVGDKVKMSVELETVLKV